MSGTLAPVGRQQEIDGNGAPLAGALLYTYAAGTSTPATTYNNVDLDPLHANANPVEADADGRFGAIYLANTSYKFVLTDADGNIIWTQDDIPSTGITVSGVGLGQYFGGDPTSPITLTSYPAGTSYAACHAGTAILPIDSANLSGTYVIGGMLMVVGSVTVTIALVNLSDGSPDTPLVTISSGSTTGAYVQSGAITFPAAGAAKNYALKAKVSGGTGFAWAMTLTKTA